jgi:septal ring factor EnvC (AmiA/AmiB activator)
VPGGPPLSREQLVAELAELKQQEQDLYDQLAALEKEKADAAANLDEVRKAREEEERAKQQESGEEGGGLVADVLGSIGKT